MSLHLGNNINKVLTLHLGHNIYIYELMEHAEI